MVLTACITPAPQDTTPQEDQETPPQPPRLGSVKLSTLLPAVFTILCVAVLLLAVGLIQCRKHRGTERVLRRNIKYAFQCRFIYIDIAP